MRLLLATSLLILLVPCSVALATIWIVAISRAIRTTRQVPSLRAGVALSDRTAVSDRIVAIVPAHNEEGAIATVIGSLREQRGIDLRVVVALDRCTDRTRARAEAAIAGDPRFEILEIDACPDGWAGKVNALWQAATGSRPALDADLLLFLDADIAMEADCVRAAAALRRERGLEMVTLLPTLRHRHWFERIVQPACALELAYEFPLLRANRATGGRPFVNGQFLMIPRAAYDRLGGHAAVADHFMEDFALARLAAEHALPMGVFPADGLLVANMYDSWQPFVRGWTRIFVSGAGQKVRRVRKWAARLGLACALLPLVVAGALLLGATATHAAWWARAISGGAAAAALAIWGGFMLWAFGRQRAPWWSAVLAPVGFAMTAWIMWRAAGTLAGRRPITWAGKSYVFDAR